jgi:LppP/LprE lipoprotein
MNVELASLLLSVVTLVPGAGAPGQTGKWLDGKPGDWNKAGAPVPRAKPNHENADRCRREYARTPSTPADRQVAAAGWQLYGPTQIYNQTAVVSALSGYDGMCRPFGYQTFVFQNGKFAGTISPAPMDSRTDGAAVQPELFSADSLRVQFQRYSGSDPLCCPSRTTSVTYKIENSAGGPRLSPTNVSTSDNPKQ